MKDLEICKIVEVLEFDDFFRGRFWVDKGYVVVDGVLYCYGFDNEEDDDVSLVVLEYECKDVLVEYYDVFIVGYFGVE